jgi:hypothetical protein
VKYRWKRLSGDGLLKEPKDYGPHYAEERVNAWDGFDSKEEAIARVKELKDLFSYFDASELVLIEQYQ